MKKFALLIGTVALVFASCTQEMPGTDPNAPQDVIFTSAIEGGLKGLKAGDPTTCSNPEAEYALVVLSGETYYPAVFMVDNILYTQAIKLLPGDYLLETFALMDDNGTPNDKSDDVIVRAAPNTGSEFAAFVTNPLSLGFHVNAFEKIEIPVEVLCFEETSYQHFGFAWFKPVATSVHQMWFFGDFCTKFFMNYTGSLYESQKRGLQIDMPAIFNIELYQNGILTATYSNEEYFGEGKPLSVKYSDKTGIEDNFELKLNVLVKVGDEFTYKYMHSWFFQDDEVIINQHGIEGPGEDGVYDFVLGNCNAIQADFAFAPYMNLPETAGMSVVQPSNDPDRDCYLTMTFTGIGSGFDIADGSADGFCFDRGIVINTGTPYTVNIYSSLLSPSALPERIRDKEWDRVNWLANHLEQFSGYKWYDFQQVLWKLENDQWDGSGYANVPAVSFTTAGSMAKQMYEAAVAYGDGYVPLPGGWAAVACINSDPDPLKAIQTVFTIVDP